MTSEEIIAQSMLANDLANCFSDSHSLDSSTILDTLANCGLKLSKLDQKDFDEEGVSLVSKAYMYSVFEKVESYHYSFKDSLSDDQNSLEDFDESFEDDLDADEFFESNDFDTETDI